MRIVLSLVIALFLSLPVMAEERLIVESMASTDSLTNILVPNAITVYTKSFSLVNHDLSAPVGVMYKITSTSGNPNVTITAEQSFQRPTTEAVVDPSYIIWETVATSETEQVWRVATLDTVIMPYARFKIVGNSGNGAGVTVQIKVGKR